MAVLAVAAITIIIEKEVVSRRRTSAQVSASLTMLKIQPLFGPGLMPGLGSMSPMTRTAEEDARGVQSTSPALSVVSSSPWTVGRKSVTTSVAMTVVLR